VENLRPRKVTVNEPAFTSLSPQTNHKNTSSKHWKFIKTPSKNTNPTTLRKKKKLDPTFYDFWNP
jgi:hypothetical protein